LTSKLICYDLLNEVSSEINSTCIPHTGTLQVKYAQKETTKQIFESSSQASNLQTRSRHCEVYFPYCSTVHS